MQLLILCALLSTAQLAVCLSPSLSCQYCQLAVQTVHARFAGRTPSKRILAKQLKRECNRHYTYRRRCHSLVRDQPKILYSEMIEHSFKPIKVCNVLKECKPFESPLVEEQLVALNETLPFIPHESLLLSNASSVVFPNGTVLSVDAVAALLNTTDLTYNTTTVLENGDFKVRSTQGIALP